jgi:hypothetical protein
MNQEKAIEEEYSAAKKEFNIHLRVNRDLKLNKTLINLEILKFHVYNFFK